MLKALGKMFGKETAETPVSNIPLAHFQLYNSFYDAYQNRNMITGPLAEKGFPAAIEAVIKHVIKFGKWQSNVDVQDGHIAELFIIFQAIKTHEKEAGFTNFMQTTAFTSLNILTSSPLYKAFTAKKDCSREDFLLIFNSENPVDYVLFQQYMKDLGMPQCIDMASVLAQKNPSFINEVLRDTTVLNCTDNRNLKTAIIGGLAAKQTKAEMLEFAESLKALKAAKVAISQQHIMALAATPAAATLVQPLIRISQAAAISHPAVVSSLPKAQNPLNMAEAIIIMAEAKLDIPALDKTLEQSKTPKAFITMGLKFEPELKDEDSLARLLKHEATLTDYEFQAEFWSLGKVKYKEQLTMVLDTLDASTASPAENRKQLLDLARTWAQAAPAQQVHAQQVHAQQAPAQMKQP